MTIMKIPMMTLVKNFLSGLTDGSPGPPVVVGLDYREKKKGERKGKEREGKERKGKERKGMEWNEMK